MTSRAGDGSGTTAAAMSPGSAQPFLERDGQLETEALADPVREDGSRGGAVAATAVKALAVLEAVGEAQRPLRFHELARACGLPKATLHRMLGALLSFDLVSLDQSTQTYRLGLRLIDLANKLWDDLDIRGAAERELERVRQLSGQTAHLGMLDGTHIVYLDERTSLQAIRLYYNSGRRLPAHCTAIGKAILAFLPQRRQEELLGRIDFTFYTPQTIIDIPGLRAELAITRERGYAVDDEEHEVERRCVAAPIFDDRGLPLAAIGLSGPARQLTSQLCHAHAPDLMAAASRIARWSHEAEAAPWAGEGSHVVPDDPRVRCMAPSAAFLGDSPVWCDRRRRLFWVDMLAPAVHCFDPATHSDRVTPLPNIVGAIALRQNDGLVLALQSGFALIEPDGEVVAMVGDPEADKPQNRFNDGKCDRRGRFWAGTMSMVGAPGCGALYQLDRDCRIRRMAGGFDVCNGIDWSLDDRTLYLSDPDARRIYAFDFDLAAGEIEHRRVLVEWPAGAGRLGGITVDADGCLWTALWDAGSVVRLDPEGRVVGRFKVPAPRPTSVMFGGAALDTLFVTTARLRMLSHQLSAAPLSGSVFAIDDCGARGVAQSRFAG